MFKPTTAGLVLFLAAIASQCAYAAPAPNPKFKIPGLGTYRSGVGFVDDVTELPWKQTADAEAKAAKAASGGDTGAVSAAMGGAAGGAVIGGVAGGVIGAGQGVGSASPGSTS